MIKLEDKMSQSPETHCTSCYCAVAQGGPWAAGSSVSAPDQQTKEERERQEGKEKGKAQKKSHPWTGRAPWASFRSPNAEKQEQKQQGSSA